MNEMLQKNIRTYFSKFFELSVWITALLLLAFMPPTDTHFSLCPLNALGADFCPGCGLGHSISWFFHGNIIESLKTHPLGIAAVIIILFRISKLIRRCFIYDSLST
jgi:hypothetical protein